MITCLTNKYTPNVSGMRNLKDRTYGADPTRERSATERQLISKAQILLNRQFQSVFTTEDVTAIPTLPGRSPHPDLEPLRNDV